ncbi:hypothetical protein [Planctomyces sp. SH-PL14]|uniref:hypothetical protein n=1 Tax=Planctomyces sp. SH-PL14 TaxID=1632864 RepID=UPI00078B756F|nr:hypothetical protein [Planctomyces sp. SH-PL14]AMV22283.1 hypothetical protein VT03_30545 [Planctomyces sp. SH-PL14]
MLRSIKLTVVALPLLAVGCETGAPPPQAEKPRATDSHDHDHDHDHGKGDHGHGSEGPHHGALVELGGDEYHAEVVHDDASGAVTVYLLDGSAKKAAVTEAQAVTLNVKLDGKPQQFQLAAEPDMGDPAGKSSRFVLKSPELIKALDDKGAEATLSLTVGGTPFSGKVPAGHPHDHDHDHDH